MWRHIVSRRNWLSVNQTTQCLKRSAVVSPPPSFSAVSLNQTAPYCVTNRQFQQEFDTSSKASRKVMAKQSDVSLSLAKHLFLKEANKNVVVSPLLIQVVLCLVAAGSKGSTLRQLLSFLKATSVDDLTSFASDLSNFVFADDDPYLSFSNGLWFDQSLILKPSFEQIVDSHYQATLAQVDFQNEAGQATQQINSWVEKETRGLIKNLISRGCLGRLDRLIFVNALYFKGAWLKKFDSSKTKDHEFYLGSDGNSVKAPFMTSKEEHEIRICDGFKVLGLPYYMKTSHFTMYIFLPDSNDGLPSLVEKFGSQSNFLKQHLPKTLVEVGDLRIPKFKISSKVMASDLLKELGLTLPFIGGELTEMADSVLGEPLYVSNILQKAFIEVNEEGTKAAAANGMEMEGCAPNFQPPPKIDFVADHPFLFVIRENITGAVLFVGQVLNPLAE